MNSNVDEIPGTTRGSRRSIGAEARLRHSSAINEDGPPFSPSWWRETGRICVEEFRLSRLEAMTGLGDDEARQLLHAGSGDRSHIRTIAVCAGLIGLALGAASIVWGHSRSANALATAAGLAIGIPVAVLIVDAMVRRERRTRYAEIVWIVTQTALQIVEDLAQTIALSASMVGRASSIELYFRAASSMPNGPDVADEEADYWRSRTSAEARWHSKRLFDLGETSARYATDGTPLSDVAANSLSTATSRLARLEDLGARLVPAAADDNDILGLVRLLWRAGDQRHSVAEALEQRRATGDDDVVWQCLGQLLGILQPLYNAALDVASAARGPADWRQPERGFFDGPWQVRFRRRDP